MSLSLSTGSAGVAATDETTAPTDGPEGGTSRVRLLSGWLITALSCLLVAFILLAPNDIHQLTPLAFARGPVEALVAVPLLLGLPPRARQWVAGAAGAMLGLLCIVKVFD